MTRVTRTVTWSYDLPIASVGSTEEAKQAEEEWDLNDHIISLRLQSPDKVQTSLEFSEEV